MGDTSDGVLWLGRTTRGLGCRVDSTLVGPAGLVGFCGASRRTTMRASGLALRRPEGRGFSARRGASRREVERTGFSRDTERDDETPERLPEPRDAEPEFRERDAELDEPEFRERDAELEEPLELDEREDPEERAELDEPEERDGCEERAWLDWLRVSLLTRSRPSAAAASTGGTAIKSPKVTAKRGLRMRFVMGVLLVLSIAPVRPAYPCLRMIAAPKSARAIRGEARRRSRSAICLPTAGAFSRALEYYA